jgi:predicted nuclease of predicted toxin-antitoxin system
MRVLLDECVDPRVKRLFGGHEVSTVHEQEWDALEDGPLLERAQREFDVLVTIDGSIEHQQNLARYRIAVVVVQVPKNQVSYFAAIQDRLLAAVENARAGEAVNVRSTPV